MASLLSSKVYFLYFVVLARIFNFVLCENGQTCKGSNKQDWGYVRIRDGAHMFYWLYYTTNNISHYTNRPLVVWLQGGPGVSSTGYGNFDEIGPFDVNLKPRNHTWIKNVNVLFIDSPVGTGFSYVDNEKYFATDNTIIALDLVTLMKTFYCKHPEFKTVPLHIFGESYGGKMAVEFALELNKAIKRKEIYCQLKSVALGDPWIVPNLTIYSWAPVLLTNGFIDKDGYDIIMDAAQNISFALHEQQYDEATKLFMQMQSIITAVTAGVDFYNMLHPAFIEENSSSSNECAQTIIKDTYSAQTDLLNKLMTKIIAKELNIPTNIKWGSQMSALRKKLNNDFMKPVNNIVETLLNTTNIHLHVYTGQLDLICSTPSTAGWVNSLRWSCKNKYMDARRYAIIVNGVIEGFRKHIEKFSMYWVLRSGHMVPTDNPIAMDYILKKVTKYNQELVH